MQDKQGVPASPSGHSPKGGAAKASPAKPSVPNAGFRYEEARSFVISRQHANCMEIKRHLHVGYNEAARYMERLEAEGVVSSTNDVGQRRVLIAAQGIEAGTATTAGRGPKDESPVTK